MARSKIEALLLLLLTLDNVRDEHAQLTAVITPRGYNASLDPETSFTFQCDVTGADRVQWLVDGVYAELQEIVDRGIFESTLMTTDQATGSFRRNISISRKCCQQKLYNYMCS